MPLELSLAESCSHECFRVTAIQQLSLVNQAVLTLAQVCSRAAQVHGFDSYRVPRSAL